MFKSQSFYKSILCFCMLSMISICTYAESITGIITDRDNNPLPGVTIQVLGTPIGTISDKEGYFEIKNLSNGTYEILISSIGFSPIHKTVDFSGKAIKFTVALEEDLTELSMVVVEGKQETREIETQPITISSISALGLSTQSLGAQELLKQTSGVMVRQMGGLGSDVNININGLTGNAVRTYYDGIPLEVFGGGIQINNIPVDALSRIDVYKGVMPVEYGTDALGGGINLVPRKNRSNFLSTSYEIGSFNTHRLTFNAGKELGNKSYLSIRSFGNYSDNDFVMKGTVNRTFKTNSYGFEQADIETIDARRFHDQHHSVSTTITARFWDLSWTDDLRVSLLYNDRSDEIQNGQRLGETAIGEATRDIRNISQWIDYRKLLFNKLNLRYVAVLTQTNDLVSDSTRNVYNWRGEIIDRNINGAEINANPMLRNIDNNGVAQRGLLNYAITKNLFLVASNFNRFNKIQGSDPYNQLSINGESVDPNNTPSELRSNIFGVQLEYDLLKSKLNVQGLFKKYSYDATSIDITVEQSPILPIRTVNENFNGFGFALKYQFSTFTYVRSSFERAGRIPTENEIFGNFAGILPNFSLRPERSDNVNVGLGYDQPILGFSDFNFSVDVFQRNQKDLIRITPFGVESSRFENEAIVDGSGIETTIRFSPVNDLKVAGNFTYQENLINTPNINGAIEKGTQVPNLPTLFWNVSVDYVIKELLGGKLDLAPFANYFFTDEYSILVGEIETNTNDAFIIPKQRLLNVGFILSPDIEGLDFSFTIRNLTNQLIYDNFRIPRPGINYSFKVSYTI